MHWNSYGDHHKVFCDIYYTLSEAGQRNKCIYLLNAAHKINKMMTARFQPPWAENKQTFSVIVSV